MAAADLPDQKQKQALLYKPDTKPQELINWGRKFQEAGWYRDAILFFTKAEDRQGLEGIRRQMIEEGDVFLFRQVLVGLDESASDDEWRQLGDRAMTLGKLQFAREAYRMIGDRKSIDKIDKMINPKAEEADSPPDDSGESEAKETS